MNVKNVIVGRKSTDLNLANENIQLDLTVIKLWFLNNYFWLDILPFLSV
jgi:hypothetical protein